MKITQILAAIGIIAFLFACNKPAEKTQKPEEVSAKEEMTSEKAPEQNVDSLMQIIDQKRAEIEANLAEPMIVTTENLREKVKQKWEKIHFYSANGNLVRIKTYPYDQISKRTEEFYLENGNLILAVIEDDGSGERGKGNENLDKQYYFNNSKILKENHASEEGEYTLRESDGEELLSELNEYLEIFKNASK